MLTALLCSVLRVVVLIAFRITVVRKSVVGLSVIKLTVVMVSVLAPLSCPGVVA